MPFKRRTRRLQPFKQITTQQYQNKHNAPYRGTGGLKMTIQSYKGRNAQIGQVVEVYRNLHNGLLSIRDPKTKLILGHTKDVYLTNVTFSVSESGRKRVLRELKKNVHAYVRGTLESSREPVWAKAQVVYNPYKYSTFIDGISGEPIYAADAVIIDNFGKMYVVQSNTENMGKNGLLGQIAQHNFEKDAEFPAQKIFQK